MDDNGGAAGPLLLGCLLNLLHQVQEWGGPVWGLLVGPGCEPVMLQASLFCPTLSRTQRPTPDTRELFEPTDQPRDGDGREGGNTQEGGHREWGLGPLPSIPHHPAAPDRDPKPGGQQGLVSSDSTGLHVGSAPATPRSSKRGEESLSNSLLSPGHPLTAQLPPKSPGTLPLASVYFPAHLQPQQVFPSPCYPLHHHRLHFGLYHLSTV